MSASWLRFFWPAPTNEMDFCGMCGLYLMATQMKTRECGTCGDDVLVCFSHPDIPRCLVKCSPHTKVTCEVCAVPMHRTVGEHVVCTLCEKDIVVCRLHIVENKCKNC